VLVFADRVAQVHSGPPEDEIHFKSQIGNLRKKPSVTRLWLALYDRGTQIHCGQFRLESISNFKSPMRSLRKYCP
jgi:hypothetical protein